MTLNIDRSTWKRVRFGDVVVSVNDAVKDPGSAGIEHVIAMEHLNPRELKVTRWGSISDGTTFTRRVKPGQTLFGKRRAYQRKVAYAEFDAICSGDILVFEAKPDRLLPELLPFLVMSDGFFDYALGTSAGSLSPRTRWSDLAKYEVDVPPLDEQKRIAELLWAAEDHRLATMAVGNRLDAARAALHDETFPRWLNERARPVSEMFDFQLGKMISPKSAPEPGRGYPYLANIDVRWRSFNLTNLRTVALSEPEREKFLLQPGDVLACEGRGVGRSAVWRGELKECYYQKALHRLRAREDTPLRPDVLVEFLAWCSETGRFRRLVGDNLIPHLTEVKFKTLRAPLPTREAQTRFLDELAVLNEADESSRSGTRATAQLTAILLKELWSQ
jgi:type I restriction enzyme S subunit